jgi:hypothetical protein
LVKNIGYIVCFLFCLVISSCQESDVVEIEENNAPATASLEVVSELFSTFDIVDDLATTEELLLKKGNELLPHEVDVIFIDNTFDDGDGIELELDFGSPGIKPYGILCRDGKYRAGTLKLTFSKRYSELGCDIGIIFPSDNPYYSGDGEVLNQFIGEIHVTRNMLNQLTLVSKDLQVVSDGIESFLTANITATKDLDWSVGIINDIVNFDGTFEMQTGSSILSLKTIEPLQKRYTLECAKYIVSGKLSALPSQSASKIEIDFDPYQDNACDNVVSITVNGKTIIHKY